MNRYIYIYISLIIVILSSCKKSFLDVEDNSNPNRQSYVKDLNSMQEFANGIYVMLSIKYERNTNAAYSGLVSDELKVSSVTRALALHNNWSQVIDANNPPSNSKSMNETWQDYYQIIRSCNFVIENIDKYSTENPEKAKNIKGQAYAIRALVHFKLTNIFAQGYSFTTDASHPGVPYITTSDITESYFRQTVGEDYSNIIADLQTAFSLLPVSISDCRYLNGPAAKALLARVYLFKNDYNNAKKLSQELINQYPLLSISHGYPADVFKNKSIDQTEVFFQITPIYTNTLLSLFLGFSFDSGHYFATQDIASLLNENKNDVRNSWIAKTDKGWKVAKFYAGAAGGISILPSLDYYVPVIRSSEMFLTAAESSAKLNDETNARLYLNAIRKRADPTIADVTATGQALIDSIYKERRKELSFEGLRMFDIQRWKMQVQRTDVFSGYQTTLPYPSDKAIAPIPVQDVILMGLKQNQGY